MELVSVPLVPTCPTKWVYKSVKFFTLLYAGLRLKSSWPNLDIWIRFAAEALRFRWVLGPTWPRTARGLNCDLMMVRARSWADGQFADPLTTPHDHTWSPLLTHATKAQTNLENDPCSPPFYSQNKRTKPAPNLNPFSWRVSCTLMVTLAHTYILTRNPHMCSRTDYHSVYTHTNVNSVYIYANIHTNIYKLCVPIRKYVHKHMQTLCVYT